MAKLSTTLRSIPDGVTFWCPGCNSAHSIYMGTWTWNGSVDSPTFSPSVLITSGHYVSSHKSGDSCWCTYNAKCEAEGKRKASFKCERCHSFVENGNIRFLNDSTHALAGQTVPIPAWPHAEGEYGGV